jgi:hypothetical protein
VYYLRSGCRAAILAALLLWILTGAWADDYASAQGKIQQIEGDKLPSGSRIVFSAAELNAYIQHQVPTVTAGVRQPRLELLGQGVARAGALVDFAKLRASEGHPSGWLLSMLLEGEHPVSVTARINSSAGQATVHVQQVEIGGVSVSGATLDFLIQHFLLPLYPDAVVDRPFALAHRIDRVEVENGRAIVVIGH